MSLIRFSAKNFLSGQLARPSGIFGRVVMPRLLNRTTWHHNTQVLQALSVGPSDAVLEIGFGGGALMERVLRSFPGVTVSGLEISEEMVEAATKRFRRMYPAERFDICKGEVSRLPYPDATFDRVCSVNTIYFWDNLPKALGEIQRVLKPGGLLVLGYVDEADLRGAGLDRRGFQVYSERDLLMALTNAGFHPGTIESGRDRRGKFYSLVAWRPSQ